MIITYNQVDSAVVSCHTLPSIPLLFSPVSAGFPAPSDSYIEKLLDLNEHCVQNPIATYFVRVDDDWGNLGVREGDILIVDRGIEPGQNALVLADCDGHRTLYQLLIRDDRKELIDDVGRCFEVDGRIIIWGTITYIIRRVQS